MNPGNNRPRVEEAQPKGLLGLMKMPERAAQIHLTTITERFG